MKRPPEASMSAYASLCSRLGVQPKQFTVLLAVAGSAVALLVGKSLLTGPRSASAGAPPAPPAATTAPPGTAPAPAGALSASPAPATTSQSSNPESSESGSSGKDAGTRTASASLRLETAPRRDPFQHFIERPKNRPLDPSAAPDADALTAPDITQFQLRATMDAEWVVINGQTLRKGETVGLAPDGTPIKLREIGHRSAILEWRGRPFEISFIR